MNWFDWILVGSLAVLFVLALRHIIRQVKRGRACGCSGCEGCPGRSGCDDTSCDGCSSYAERTNGCSSYGERTKCEGNQQHETGGNKK